MNLSWTILDRLARRYGCGFHLLDLPLFEENYQTFAAAIGRFYPNSKIAYSYKTNYVPALCRRVNELGGYAEVVSGMEYQLALRVGVSPKRIIFNGPLKPRDELECALLAGSIVNLDSIREIEVLETVAARFPDTTLWVGVRCNFPVEESKISRFGFDADSDQLKRIFDRLRRIPSCNVMGLHCHFSTREKSAESYAIRISRLLELGRQHFGAEGLRMINIGGGYFSRLNDAQQKRLGVHAPDWDDYAAAIGTPLAKAYPDGHGPELVLEPGTALVANVMQFATQIVELKSIGTRTMALVAGSIHNIKPTLHEKEMSFQVFRAPENEGRGGGFGPVDLVGYTCMEHDCLYHAFQGNLAPGDFVVFDNVGAYTVVMKPPFIQPSPAIVALRRDDLGFDLVKRRETASDVFATYS